MGLTKKQRWAYARAARENPKRLSDIAAQAGVQPETVKDWVRKFFGSTGSNQNDPTQGLPTALPVPPPPPPKPPPASTTTVRSATEDSTDALAKRMKKWFRGKGKRREDANKLSEIISDWRENYKQASVTQPGVVAGGLPNRPTTPPKTGQIHAPPPAGCNVYILDAGLLSALASNGRDAWACLEMLVGELNVVVVPAGSLGCAFRDELPHRLLERALASACLKQVPLGHAEARAAGMLCRATSTNDLIDASVVITAKACRQALNRKRARRKCAVRSG